MLKIRKVRNVKTPTRGTDKSAGIDFYVPYDIDCPNFKINVGLKSEKYNTESACIILMPGESAKIPSGIKVKIPEGYAFIAFNKSGIALTKTLSIGACVVDEDYQGEISLHVYNRGNEAINIFPGQKLVQFILIPVIYPEISTVYTDEELFEGNKSQRGHGGFGSTGII